MTDEIPKGYSHEVEKIRTLGQKVNDVTVRLRGIGDQLGLPPSAELMSGVEVMSSEVTYLDEIVAQIEECRSWVQVIQIELNKL